MNLSKDPQAVIERLRQELIGNHSSALAGHLIKPNARMEVEDKRRPSHFIPMSRQAGVNITNLPVTTLLILTAAIPEGFEFIHAVYSPYDDQYVAIVDFKVDKWGANIGKAPNDSDWVPLSMLDAMMRREMAFAPSGMPGHKVRATDLTCTLSLIVKQTIPATYLFGGIGLCGIDHNGYCQLKGKLVRPDTFSILGMAGKGTIQQMVGGITGRARELLGSLGNPSVSR